MKPTQVSILRNCLIGICCSLSFPLDNFSKTFRIKEDRSHNIYYKIVLNLK